MALPSVSFLFLRDVLTKRNFTLASMFFHVYTSPPLPMNSAEVSQKCLAYMTMVITRTLLNRESYSCLRVMCTGTSDVQKLCFTSSDLSLAPNPTTLAELNQKPFLFCLSASPRPVVLQGKIIDICGFRWAHTIVFISFFQDHFLSHPLRSRLHTLDLAIHTRPHTIWRKLSRIAGLQCNR